MKMGGRESSAINKCARVRRSSRACGAVASAARTEGTPVTNRVAIGEVVSACDAYVALAGGLGLEVKKGALRQHALQGLEYRGDMKSFFSASYAKQYPIRSAPAKVFDVVADLRNDLEKIIRKHLNGQLSKDHAHSLDAMLKALQKLDARQRSTLASAASRGKHAEFLKPAEVSIAEFHKALHQYAGEQSIARSKLVEYIRAELEKLGTAISSASVEERLRRNTKVRTVPAAMIDIVRKLDTTFKSGLIPIETMTAGQDPALWLENARVTLGFRSKNALHKALAHATTVNYETIHKALTNPHPGQRIRIEIRECLNQWFEKSKRGQMVPLQSSGHDHGAAPIVRPILGQLAPLYPCVNAMYREAARALSVSSSSVRKIYEGGPNGRVTQEGIAALRNLLEMRKNRPAATSYLLDRSARRLASSFAEKAERAKTQWETKKDDRMHDAFKRYRLKMIIALKEGRIPERERDFEPAELPEPEYAEAM